MAVESNSAVVDAPDFSREQEEILQLLRQNRLVLPGVPELANRVRQAVADPASSVARIAGIISADPALAAHLVKVGNSVAYRRGDTVSSVRTAVTRLGLRLTAMSATSFSIMQMMALAHGQQARVRALYRHSLAVGERCFALARRLPSLLPEDALLAGLVHDIGVLPVLQYAHLRPRLATPARLQALIAAVHAPVGAELLRSWRFPEPLAEAVQAHESWYRQGSSGRPDYADLLIAANLDLHRGSAHPITALDSAPAPALLRLGLIPGRPLADRYGWADDVAVARGLCGMDDVQL